MMITILLTTILTKYLPCLQHIYQTKENKQHLPGSFLRNYKVKN